jgi:hypothetical protein
MQESLNLWLLGLVAQPLVPAASRGVGTRQSVLGMSSSLEVKVFYPT